MDNLFPEKSDSFIGIQHAISQYLNSANFVKQCFYMYLKMKIQNQKSIPLVTRLLPYCRSIQYCYIQTIVILIHVRKENIFKVFTVP